MVSVSFSLHIAHASVIALEEVLTVPSSLEEPTGEVIVKDVFRVPKTIMYYRKYETQVALLPARVVTESALL